MNLLEAKNIVRKAGYRIIKEVRGAGYSEDAMSDVTEPDFEITKRYLNNFLISHGLRHIHVKQSGYNFNLVYAGIGDNYYELEICPRTNTIKTYSNIRDDEEEYADRDELESIILNFFS